MRLIDADGSYTLSASDSTGYILRFGGGKFVADYAEKTRIFQENKERGTMFDGSTLQQIFGYLLDRIVNAPTSIHREFSIILIMPFVRQKLAEEA